MSRQHKKVGIFDFSTLSFPPTSDYPGIIIIQDNAQHPWKLPDFSWKSPDFTWNYFHRLLVGGMG